MAGQESLRAAAARDRDFLGVDIVAMARLIEQLDTASATITGWLRANGALPPSVPRTGVRQAGAVQSWVNGQSGMLTRRRNYAVTHLGATAPAMPRVGPGRLGHHTTAVGAGRVGRFTDVRAATRAGAVDAAAIRRAVRAHEPIPPEVWRRLAADADDPDHARGLHARLGPAGAADLVWAALGDRAHLTAVETSLGVASHHLTMDEAWLRRMLAEATRLGVHDEVVRALADAGLDHRSTVALGHLGLTHPPHDSTAARGRTHPPHEAMLRPAAADPYAAVELYARHPEAVHAALAAGLGSEALALLVTTATTATEADPDAVRANAERLAGFRAAGGLT